MYKNVIFINNKSRFQGTVHVKINKPISYFLAENSFIVIDFKATTLKFRSTDKIEARGQNAI